MSCTLEPCVTLLLRSLSPADLRGFRDGLLTQKDLVDAEILQHQAQLLKNDSLAAHVNALALVANAALDEVERGLAFFPTNLANLIAQCATMGAVQVAPETALENIREIVNDLLYRVREFVSFADELRDIIQALQNLSSLLTDMAACIADTIIELEAPPAA